MRFLELYLAYGDKAMGLDGFTLAFWQCYWEHVKSKVIGFFEEFYEARSFEKSSNATFLVLVPKKGGAKDLKDCRPTRLVGGLYKLSAKVLAIRLKRVVGTLISEFQLAFVRGRQILGVVLIANEANNSRLKDD